MTNGNGAPTLDATPAQFGVLVQYTKDFSFENPNAPASLTQQGQQPAVSVQINVGATNLGGPDFEVALTTEVKAEINGSVLFALELIYAGIFRIENMPSENLHPFVMIECPRLLFPFVREIVATTTRNGGFPPVWLEPVDFVGLYRQNMARQAEQFKPS
ncbi:MAG: protein-export chaperone SecB [Xanthobacteraceae bacterium]|nr:protein-export chaperone SecB [Xanthobacteraceae bacterium]